MVQADKMRQKKRILLVPDSNSKKMKKRGKSSLTLALSSIRYYNFNTDSTKLAYCIITSCWKEKENLGATLTVLLNLLSEKEK